MINKEIIKAKEETNQTQFEDYWKSPVKLGPYTSHIWRDDPRHIGFLFSRYKFCAKMLEGKGTILEIGCGDATGTPVVAQTVEKVHATDWEPLLMEDNRERLKDFSNIDFSLLDITERAFEFKCDAVFSLDVLEHIKPELEENYFKNICKSLKENGVCIIGTPNVKASQHAGKFSKEAHINLKSHEELKNLMKQYFENVFMFSMNDEVLHIGYAPMAHYIFGMGVSKKI